MSAWWSWALASIGVFGLWLTTCRDWRGYVVGLGVQGLWISYAVLTGQWGFIASAIAYGTVNAIGIYAWRKKPSLHARTNRDGEWKCQLCGKWRPIGQICDGSE